ncbi:MAG: hypothetical protein MZV65_48950 [Chromatiales bacterium]|nr:hypothetical protein [Chromatiales bacterium]
MPRCPSCHADRRSGRARRPLRHDRARARRRHRVRRAIRRDAALALAQGVVGDVARARLPWLVLMLAVLRDPARW